MANQRLGVDATKFFFADRESHDRHIGCLQALVTKFLVEGNVRIAVDRGNHGRFAACRKFLDVGDDRLIIRMAERRVLLVDILVIDTF